MTLPIPLPVPLPQLPFARLVLACLFGGALLAPPFAFSHSGELLLARFIQNAGPEVTLEITADLAANPHFQHSTPSPLEQLGKVLRVRLPSGRSWDIGELGSPKTSIRDGFQFPAPIPLQHAEGEKAPELFTASWTWRPSETPLRFEIPQGNPHTVVFWSVHPGAPSTAFPDWRMLLAGDIGPKVELRVPPQPLQWTPKARIALGFAALGLLGNGAYLLQRLRALKKSPTPR